MKNIPVNVKRDHLAALATYARPVGAVAELLWNSLDADADKVAVYFGFNPLGALETIRVSDNGYGIRYDAAEDLFGNLGGSWKTMTQRTAKGRSIHGKSGKGRFRAFSLGSHVDWTTTSRANGSVVSFTVQGRFDHIDTFQATDPKPSTADQIGTEVTISICIEIFDRSLPRRHHKNSHSSLQFI